MMPYLGVLTKPRKFSGTLLRGRLRTPIPQHVSLPKFCLVCSLGLRGSHNKILLAGRLGQQTLFLTVWGLDIGDQGAGVVGFW